ncbi:MAG: tryptophan synthase subunit alpha, partial [bacterium]
MGRIGERFAALRAQGETALIPFVTAGDPDLETTEALVLAMAEAGADLIEIGVPFSDPIAEGPTIQRSSARALARGTSLRGILQLVARLRDRVEQPLVLMGYANPIHAMGGEAFAKAAAEVGVDGVIVPDLTPEDGIR